MPCRLCLLLTGNSMLDSYWDIKGNEIKQSEKNCINIETKYRKIW